MKIMSSESLQAEIYAERSKHRGDYYSRLCEQITGSGDYVAGRDDGEEPKYTETRPQIQRFEETDIYPLLFAKV